MVGERQLGLVGIHRSLRLGDQRSLTLEGRPRIVLLRGRHQQLRLRRRQGRLIVTVVDQRQHLAGLDLLVVFDQHLLDKARHLGRDHGVVR
ncbi:hypothetical protein D3C80_1552990 [compost metagenome]